MAAQVRTKKGKAKPSLVNKLELTGDTIYSAVFIPHEDSIITVASDKYALLSNFLFLEAAAKKRQQFFWFCSPPQIKFYY